MRAILSVLVAVSMAATGSSALRAQTDQAPVFRSGVEVMEVDVTVVDAKGMPVRDLRAPDFTVTVDGQPRRVISAEFISASYAPSNEPAKPRDPYVSNNTDRRPGRLIMIVIDRNNIDTHTIRTATGALKQFVTSIAPEDRLALFTIPPPGPSVDFTTNHAQVLDAITRIIGSDEPMMSQYNVSDYEAVTFENRSNPIATQRLLFRACGDTDPNTMSPCDRDVEQEALTIATHIRHLTAASVSGFAALLKNLRDVEGPKSMIVMSQGLMLEASQGEASTLATLAAEARVSINVMMFAQADRQCVAGPPLRNVVAGSRSARGRSRDAGRAIARLALSRRHQSRVRLRAPAQRAVRALHARRRAAGAGPRRAAASDSRADRPAERADPSAAAGAVREGDAQELVARRGDGARAAIAGRQHRAADAAVDLYVPRQHPEQGEADSRRGNRSRVDGEGARSRHRLCPLRPTGQGGAERTGTEDLFGEHRSPDPLRAGGRRSIQARTD